MNTCEIIDSLIYRQLWQHECSHNALNRCQATKQLRTKIDLDTITSQRENFNPLRYNNRLTGCRR
jgi:hypothetical protein